MTTFPTPEPISVSLEFGVGDLRLVAGDAGETVVEVKPTDPAKKGDVDAAHQTQVEYSAGSLLVRGPKGWRQWTPRGGRESVDVEIRLPEGSRVSADLGMASVHSAGRLGELHIKTGMGDVRLDEAGPMRIKTGFGGVTVGRVDGDADVKTGSARSGGRSPSRTRTGTRMSAMSRVRRSCVARTAPSGWTALDRTYRPRLRSATSASASCPTGAPRPRRPAARSIWEFSTGWPPGWIFPQPSAGSTTNSTTRAVHRPATRRPRSGPIRIWATSTSIVCKRPKRE
jgi:hypothetical protein